MHSSRHNPPSGSLRLTAIAATIITCFAAPAWAQDIDPELPAPVAIDAEGAPVDVSADAPLPADLPPAEPLFPESQYEDAPVVADSVPVEPLREDAAELDSIEVTGSRLSRAAMEGALPVTVISRDAIQSSGKISVADALRSSTFNSFGSYTSISGSSGQGQSVASLRGLGSNRTLVLVDGRRIATSPSLQGSGVDLNTIPLAAVERIEVLSDGASAVYGSDAIGGVINVILRKDFNGVEISAGLGSPVNPGGDEEDASIVAGLSTGDSRMLFGAAYTNKQPIFLRDRDYSRSQFGAQNPDGTYNFSETAGISGFGNTIFNSDFSETRAVADAGCQESLGYYRLVDDVGNFTGIQGGDMCGFDFTQFAADTTELTTSSVFVKYAYDIDYNLSFEITATYAQSESFGRFAPAPDLLFVPGDAPTNPYGEDVYVAHRFLPLGTRDNNNRSGVLSILPVVRYNFGDWDIEGGARISRFTFTELGSGYLLRSVAASAAADGSYNPFDLANPGDQDTLNSMVVTTTRDGLTEYRELFATVHVPLFDTSSGVIDSAWGGEYRQERFFDNYDSQSEAGTVGGSSGNSSSGDRNAYAMFGEVVVPLPAQVEVDVAARYDHYSDAAGGAFSPKVSARWQAMDNLTVRGSVGKGFRAPLLSELNAKDAFSAESARDLVTCRAAGVADSQCAESQYDTFIKANPDLNPETSTQFGFGIAMQPLEWLDLTLDYYNITIKDSLTTYSVQSLIFRELLGQTLPDGTAVNRRDSGAIDFVETTTDNISEIQTDGIDLTLNSRFDFGNWGSIRPSLAVSYVLGYTEDDGVLPARDQVGDPGVPEYRVSLTLPWTVDAFTATWNTSYIPSTAAATDPGDPNPLALQRSGHVASNAIHDVQVKWDNPWNGSLVLGIRDVFDRGVSTNFNLTSPYYDQTLYEPQGRMPYVRVIQRF
ncbi:TonB-dependent receptor [Sinimarinibacterium sp. CAU 1509]|uniref:TonB-dependent receptor plug domain-containing protein n=1 Tax=Sinimarinibacterium sp. CAU 1509 TaxID=2562283 RepID=UPI0010ACC81C|nr:TonB-dependent receptor [Sinimarinibacterium sp. CAU 1509]TJY62064.1 TonB-dependent receptor [Sinimarinibacterium sp. CAU 1509]